MGIPRGPVSDYYFNKYGTLDRVPRTEHRGDSVNSFEECLAAIREDFKNKWGKPLGVELSNKSRVYQNPYPSYFDLVPYSVGWCTPDFVKFESASRSPCGFLCLNDKMIKKLMSFAKCETGKISCDYVKAIHSSRHML
jgi:hypothetical protein